MMGNEKIEKVEGKIESEEESTEEQEKRAALLIKVAIAAIYVYIAVASHDKSNPVEDKPVVVESESDAFTVSSSFTNINEEIKEGRSR